MQSKTIHDKGYIGLNLQPGFTQDLDKIKIQATIKTVLRQSWKYYVWKKIFLSTCLLVIASIVWGSFFMPDFDVDF